MIKRQLFILLSKFQGEKTYLYMKFEQIILVLKLHVITKQLMLTLSFVLSFFRRFDLCWSIGRAFAAFVVSMVIQVLMAAVLQVIVFSI